jgi:uncharacterized protein YPO0396
LRPLADAVQALNANWQEQFSVPADLYQDLARTQELPRLEAEMKGNIEKLNQIDRAKFDELAQEQAKLEAEMKKWRSEWEGLLRSSNRARLEAQERVVTEQRKQAEAAVERFERTRNETDVSPFLSRLEQLRQEKLAEFPLKEIAAARCKDLYHQCDRDAAETRMSLIAKRRELAIAHAKFSDLAPEAETNEAYEKQLVKLEESEIPDYHAKASRERKNWESLFRTQVLEKLHSALREVKDLLFLLNNSLRQRPIGNNRYQVHYRQNPDFKIYHELIEASSLAAPDELFFASADTRFRDAIQHFLKILTEQVDSAEATRLLDYRHYYEYDMEVLEEDGRKTSVDRHSGKFSGGENQSPYFIAILASYLRAYRRYSSRKQEPSLGLVPIDEAFSKLSGERIKDCITALKAFDLQGVFSMSTGNIPYAFEHCDWLVIVSKEERRNGKKTEIRNVPISLARESEEAQRLMGES